MAIHLLPLAKLALMTGKAGTAKASGAAIMKQAASISAQGQTPGWLVKGALAGLIAVSAGAPFLPTWAALAVGAVAVVLVLLAVAAPGRSLGAWGPLSSPLRTMVDPVLPPLVDNGISEDNRALGEHAGSARSPD